MLKKIMTVGVSLAIGTMSSIGMADIGSQAKSATDKADQAASDTKGSTEAAKSEVDKYSSMTKKDPSKGGASSTDSETYSKKEVKKKTDQQAGSTADSMDKSSQDAAKKSSDQVKKGASSAQDQINSSLYD